MKRRRADATSQNRVPFVERQFIERMRELAARAPLRTSPVDIDAPLRPGSSLTGGELLALFRSQLESRHLDFAARELKQRGASFYTIGSAGHEGNAAVAAALRPTDPALLHYRSGAFFLQRARQAGHDAAVMDVLLGLVASAEEPIAGGRHKVFGSVPLAIPPQTSTIASHLPKAVGMAFALERGKRLGLHLTVPRDAIIACTFGDASANHSTAVGAVHAAGWAAFQGAKVPVLFVCEDNGLGISVATPPSWIAASYASRAGVRYFAGDGLALEGAYAAAKEAATFVRKERRPAFLHLSVVRLLGHAGSDIETVYRSLDEIEATESRDPLLHTAETLVAAGVLDADAVLALYEQTRQRVMELAAEAVRRPKLTTRAEVMAPIAPRDDDAIANVAQTPADPAARAAFWGVLPEDDRPGPLGVTLNRALGDLLVRYPQLLLFGEDVARKGGVYGVTRGLAERARPGRVFDTLLDEQTILGTAIGAGQIGCLPLAEIQYLAYVHNAIDQLRGEASTLQFFSSAQLNNPMVVRIAAYAYQKGFGGHFHNDNAVAALREIPGIVIASPARGEDAAAMLRTCVAAAERSGSVCVFLEPIALYPVRDLYEDGDGGWLTAYEPNGEHVPIGRARAYGPGLAPADPDQPCDLCIVSWANGLYMSLRVAKRLEARGVRCRVLDLRWLAPLPITDLRAFTRTAENVLIVDETRRTGGVSEALVTALVEGGRRRAIRRVAAEDSFIPLGDAANLVLVQEPDIEAAARALLEPPDPAHDKRDAP